MDKGEQVDQGYQSRTSITIEQGVSWDRKPVFLTFKNKAKHSVCAFRPFLQNSDVPKAGFGFNESYHLVFLVALVEGLLGLARFYIHLSAHGISAANVAGTEVIGVWLAK